MKQKRKRPSNPSPVIARFIDLWRNRRFELLHLWLQITYVRTVANAIANAAAILEALPIESARVMRRVDVSPVIVDYEVRCEYSDGRPPETRVIRLVCERGPYEPDRCGEWGVNPVSIHRTLDEVPA
jgi:hypothetical protein